MKVMKAAASLVFAVFGATLHADVVAWPTAGQWAAHPLYSANGIYLSDIVKDTGNNGHLYLDYVGDSTYAAGYLFYRDAATTPGETESQLFVRLRLNKNKSVTTGAWQVLFETDGDDSVEWVLQLAINKNFNSSLLTFGSATGTNRNGVTFGSAAWNNTTGEYVNYTGTTTGDGSNFDGDADFFLDLAVPWATFSGFTGITSTNLPFRAILGSSQQAGSALDGDVGNTPSTADVFFKDVYSSTQQSIPEPAVASLILGFGVSLLAGRRLFGK